MLRFLTVLLLYFGLLGACLAQEGDVRSIVDQFAQAKKFKQVEVVIDQLGNSADPLAVRPLQSLMEGTLKVRKSDGSVHIVEGKEPTLSLRDPVNGEVLDAAGAAVKDYRKIKIKNSLRRKIKAVLSGLTLGSDSVSVRLNAAQTIFDRPDAGAIVALDQALETEADEQVREAFLDARAAAVLVSKLAAEDKMAAIERIGQRGDRAALSLLLKHAGNADEQLKPAFEAAITDLESNLASWAAAQNVWYGISLGSVLLLAAIGLAITFGVMGVINMAHGEMVMLGAYTTFAIQEFIRSSAPNLFDYSLLFAVPAAFAVSGGVGLVMERGLIRHLYGRPLETLLATWGVSLILQQTVRTIFGPTNREVGNPSWMSGALEIGELAITWNRLWIVVFAIAVFAILYLIINFSSLGLEMRAVTQNRRMAGAMGIKTSWVDAMTFALGSGIAGIAGVALSQIDNVSPNLGQSYIIDSFLVVVFGGVGNLWGTLVGAMSLGVANKFLEPYTGAVLGKILVLVLIILFIQKRPRGLFALKGRAVES
ncbi:MAG: urea ABC transporter permease subunit UrtB [Rhizobiaceae bacterium]